MWIINHEPDVCSKSGKFMAVCSVYTHVMLHVREEHVPDDRDRVDVQDPVAVRDQVEVDELARRPALKPTEHNQPVYHRYNADPESCCSLFFG